MHLRNSADKVVSHKKFKADPELLKLAEQQAATHKSDKVVTGRIDSGTNGTGSLIESTGSTKPLTPRLRRWKHQPQPLQQKRLKSHLLAKFAGSPHTRAWV